MSHVMHNPHIHSERDFSDVTGVILAGGRSRRMGQDKATLKVAGLTLFERAHNTLSSVFSQVLIAGDRPDLATAETPCFADIYPGSALGGIHTGLVAAQTPWIFVVPCDLADPDPGLVIHLLSYRHGQDVVVPRSDDGFEPVFALYHKNCLAPMEKMLQHGNFRVYDFYNQVRVRYIDAHELPTNWEKSLLNLNSPKDLADMTRETQ